MLARSSAAVGAVAIACATWLEPTAATAVAPPQARAEIFTTSEQCGVCHSVAPGANAMRSKTGDDVSPYGLWQGTMMGNAFRDPYFRAQMRKETTAAGEQVQELCLRCHAPMASHGAVLAGGKPPRLADVDGDLFADDSVSCTVCHQIAAKDLGDASTFSGKPNFGTDRKIFGPFADVATQPMQNMVRYTPTQGMHIRSSALCGTCHTLFTEHHGTPFPEQTPYLEWRNSEFNDENGRTDASRTCQQCHMADTGATRIARNPMGLDFNVPPREGYAAHAFVGGNAFMLDMLAQHADELDVTAAPEALARMAAATRRQLAESTARLSISALERQERSVAFTVRVENLTGHKFPTGYPARRAWLHVQVRRGQRVVFESGGFDAKGRLLGVGDENAEPHHATIEKPEQVAVYEMVAEDPAGEPTTFLTKMVKKRKDNRLLPRGWKADGPHIADIAPVGTAGDADFVAGGDTVAFRVPLPERTGQVQVVVRMLYQSVPPLWADALRGVPGEECERFVRMYDAADKTPETVAMAVRGER